MMYFPYIVSFSIQVLDEYMQFTEFVNLEPPRVTQLIGERIPQKLAVAMPFNGTRRWYLQAFHKQASNLIDEFEDYQVQAGRQLRAVAAMMYADGVQAVYIPLMGRALLERGTEYMVLAAQAITELATDEALAFYTNHHISAFCYGETNLLPLDIQDKTARLNTTNQGTRYLRYGIMADRPLPDLIARIGRLQRRIGKLPSEQQLLEDYYGGEFIAAGLWIGSDQPSVFDVPYAVNENTALYFLQFPTPYLDQTTWRRLLYDYLYVRGDEESLYPDNVSTERRITGLGVRRDGYWIPSDI